MEKALRIAETTHSSSSDSLVLSAGPSSVLSIAQTLNTFPRASLSQLGEAKWIRKGGDAGSEFHMREATLAPLSRLMRGYAHPESVTVLYSGP
jgi:hypothetical protein